MSANGKASSHAVVVGGSMAGLLAARVLTNHFERVTLVERDDLPDGAQPRRGVPQGRHTHGLLAGGRRVIEELFPGISDELIAIGAVAGDVLETGRWFFEGANLAKATSGLDGILVSRPALETAVRRRLLGLRRVELRQGCRVEGPVLDTAGKTVVGVRAGESVLSADLVVDATGRGSRTPQWLEASGYPRPTEEKVEIGVTYTTRLFRRAADALGGDVAVVIPATPAGKQGGVMLAQEGDRWTVTLISYFLPRAPDDLPGFIEFARGLPSPDIHEVVRSAEPIGDAIWTTFPASVRRRYEALGRFPEGFVVVGDGLCSFNPIYGQGMSVAALEALELDAALSTGGRDFARRFFARASKIIDTPWSIAVGSDLRIPEVKGPRNPGVSFVNWYLEKLHKAAHRDPELSRAFLKVANLLAPPPSVMHPRLALRVLMGGIGASAPAVAPARAAHE